MNPIELHLISIEKKVMFFTTLISSSLLLVSKLSSENLVSSYSHNNQLKKLISSFLHISKFIFPFSEFPNTANSFNKFSKGLSVTLFFPVLSIFIYFLIGFLISFNNSLLLILFTLFNILLILSKLLIKLFLGIFLKME